MHVTSGVEGYHATMKGLMGSSRGDVLTVHNRMEHWWRQTINKHRKLLSDAEVVLPTRLQSSFYADVAKVIHKHALTKCQNAYHTMDVLLRLCTGTYSHKWVCHARTNSTASLTVARLFSRATFTRTGGFTGLRLLAQ